MELTQRKEHANKPQGHPRGYKIIIQCRFISERGNGTDFDSGYFYKIVMFLSN